MKQIFYRQCYLRKEINKTESVYNYQTSFIPEKYCLYNKYLKLKNGEGVWENGWELLSVGAQSFSEDQLELRNWRIERRK